LKECYIFNNEYHMFITRDRYAFREFKKYWLSCFI